jgi:hypothetical protein
VQYTVVGHQTVLENLVCVLVNHAAHDDFGFFWYAGYIEHLVDQVIEVTYADVAGVKAALRRWLTDAL